VFAAFGVEQIVDPPELGLKIPGQPGRPLLRIAVGHGHDLDQMELVDDAPLLLKELATLDTAKKKRQLVRINLLEDLPLTPAVSIGQGIDDALQPLI